MTFDLHRRTAAATLFGCALLAGCSSSGGAAHSSSAAGSGAGSTTAPASSPASTSSSVGAANSAPTGGAPADAPTTQAVTTAYVTFFNGKTTPVNSQKFLQHGATFAKSLEKQAHGSYAQHTTAKVTTVRLANPNLAVVTFSLASNGQTLLPDITGYAVHENGAWLVAAQTFCNLLKLQGAPDPACGDAKTTALPT